MSQNCYTVGQTVRVSVAFSDLTGAAVDPSAVALRIKDPAQIVTSYALGSGVVRDAAGQYHADLPTTLAGAHLYRWEGDGPDCAAESLFFTETAF